MTKIKAELLLASKNRVTGDILYTFRLTFPRSILSEMNTHRAFSRNTASSRAIPIAKMLRAVLHDPFIPVSIGANQKGMQAGAELRDWRRRWALRVIRWFRYANVAEAWLLNKLGVHKQVANRYLEPYSWTTQIVTTTDIDNFLTLRTHRDAEPHIRELARGVDSLVREAKHVFGYMERVGERYTKSNSGKVWLILEPGEWHLPLIRPEEEGMYYEDLKRVSAARCARTSYMLLDTGKVSDLQSDLLLCDKLFGSTPKHLSPTEHPAQAMPTSRYFGNFRGFSQFRKEIPGESGESRKLDGEYFNPAEIAILSKLLSNYVVGPPGKAVLEKIRTLANSQTLYEEEKTVVQQ